MIYNSITEMVGGTPLLRLGKLTTRLRLNAEILAKCEMYNPWFSVKDRVALSLIENEEKKGIKEDTIFVEATSGNTGIGLAGVCAAKGYKLIIIMPENMSEERIKIMRHLGAEVILTPKEEGMDGAINKAKILKERNDNVVILSQFENDANPNAHRMGTAMEILEDTGGDFDVLVASVGTSGTITGIASVLKTYNKDLYVVAVEPEGSAVLSGESKGSHKIQGIGAGFVPPLYDKKLVNEVIKISDEDAIEMTKAVARIEGIGVGISSGAAIVGAIEVAKRKEFTNKRVIVILPDSIERYLSTGYF
ncbi:MAG: cysteine synthase A [Alphaproteobacteria bacterium]|nr:cysteine synthase A [Alphaproteobacteria bacterium]